MMIYRPCIFRKRHEGERLPAVPQHISEVHYIDSFVGDSLTDTKT